MKAMRKDANTDEIYSAIIKNGWRYIDTHSFGNGFPDCIAIKRIRKEYVCVFIEIKTPDGELTQKQIEFCRRYPKLVNVCVTKFDVGRALRSHIMNLRKEIKPRERIVQSRN